MDPSAKIIDEAIAQKRTLPGALLPVLHAIQDALGFIPPDAVPRVAQALNLSQAEVHGVISFYHDFRTIPPARHIVKYCRAEACQARGGEAVERALSDRLAAIGREQVALEPVYCLGLCAIGPNALVDGRPAAVACAAGTARRPV